MRFVRLVLAAAIGLFVALGAARSAHAKAKVEIVAVELTQGVTSTKARDKHVMTAVRRMANQAAKHLDFGKQGRVEVKLVVKELSLIEADGVLRVTCTLVGRLKGGGSAKSRLSFGGKPDKKKQLERQVLTSVTDGVMTRLAMLARDQQAAAN